MRTAIDTNILIDVFTIDHRFGPSSREALQQAYSSGALLVGEVVYSELAAAFPSQKDLNESLKILGVDFIGSNRDACWLAGEAWKKYRTKGGPRNRVIADFLIGANALTHADALLTRDRGFYKSYFPQLKLIQPFISP